MSKVEVLNLTKICNNFPELPKTNIARDNIINTIDTMFATNIDLIFVEGITGAGKTTLLTQFGLKYPHQTISLFINPSSSIGYDHGYLELDLCNQLNWILDGKELSDDQLNYDPSILGKLLFKLRKKIKHKNTLIYFVIDGINEIPEYARKDIINLLPLGLIGFKFIISSSLENDFSKILKLTKSKSFPITNFTYNDTKMYFQDMEISEKALTEIYSSCVGVPGRLASIKRILQSGKTVDELLENSPIELAELFKIEWQKANLDDDDLLNILAIITFTERNQNIEKLSCILNLDTKRIMAKLNELSFIEIEDQTKEVRYVSEAFRKFAASELQNYSDKTINLLIQGHMEEPSSEESLKVLPKYMYRSERYEDLLDYLNPENFKKLLPLSASRIPVLEMANLALNSAETIRSNQDMIRFGLLRSVLLNFNKANILQSEIEALISMNDYKAALSLAQSPLLDEDRLYLLSTLVRNCNENDITPDDEILEQIDLICKTIPTSALGDRLLNIASDLLSTSPNLAINLIEKSKENSNGEVDLDYAFTMLSLEALKSKENLDNKVMEDIRSHIKNPKMRNFSESINLLYSDYSGSEIISESKKIDNINNQFSFIRLWILDNYKKHDVDEVVTYGLELMVKSTDFIPNATVLRELATPLPYMSRESSEYLVGIIDSHKEHIEKIGPTEEYIKLQNILTSTLFKLDMESAKNRIIESYFYICSLDDKVVRSSCMSRLYSMLLNLDKNKDLEKKEGLHSLVHKDLEELIDELLSNTADQYYIFQGIIKSLTLTSPDKAINLSKSLNTDSRRNLALADFIHESLDTQIELIDFSKIKEAIDSITNQSLKDSVLSDTMSRFEISNEKISKHLDKMMYIFDSLKDIQIAGTRCSLLCVAFNILKKHGETRHQQFLDKILRQLTDSWNAIDPDWIKIDVGYQITKSLANSSKETAKTYLENTSKYEQETIMGSIVSVHTYLQCIELCLRAFSGLLPKNLNDEDDIKLISELIDSIPSHGEKAMSWSHLAIRFYIDGKLNECRKVISEYVRPQLDFLSKKDQKYRSSVIMTVAPALYVAHKSTAIDFLNELNYDEKDHAYKLIADLIFRKQLPTDPMDDSSKRNFILTYEEVRDVLEILESIDSDTLLYDLIHKLVNSVLDNKNKITRQQKTEVENKIKSLLPNKFPNPRNIKHDGYKIIIESQLARLSNASNDEWTNLIQRAKKINNTPDQTFTLTMLVSNMSKNKQHKLREGLLNDIDKLIQQIPSYIDKIDRLYILASIVIDFDKTRCKSYLENAMQLSNNDENETVKEIQKDLIDLAHLIEPDFASSLAKMLDDDPARRESQKRITFLDLKKELDTNQSFYNTDNLSESDVKEIGDMLLSSLNAGRIGTVNFEHIRSVIPPITTYPLDVSFNLICWIIENEIKRYAKTDEAKSYLRPMFNALFQNAVFAMNLLSNSSLNIQKIKDSGPQFIEQKSIQIGSGDREKAYTFIKGWISKATKFIWICDPYFGIEELKLVQIIGDLNTNCSIHILTSRKHQDDQTIEQPWDEAYRNYWKIHLTEQNPPDTSITVAGDEIRGGLPIHDRWILSENSGIRLGTSLNSLGLKKESEISILNSEEVEEKKSIVEKYILGLKKDYNGKRIYYNNFNL